MNIVLWVLQVLLALHTAVGAVWKTTNSEQAVPSLNAVPHGVWLTLAGFEVLLALALVLPAFSKSLGVLAPIAALCIAAEMLFFVVVHVATGHGSEYGEMVYWLVVAAVCAFVAYGRFSLRPF